MIRDPSGGRVPKPTCFLDWQNPRAWFDCALSISSVRVTGIEGCTVEKRGPVFPLEPKAGLSGPPGYEIRNIAKWLDATPSSMFKPNAQKNSR